MTRSKIQVNPARIEWCCEEAGISLEDIPKSKKPSSLEDLKNGRLTHNQLNKIAEYFHYPSLFFIAEGKPKPEEVYSAQFRTLTNKKPSMGFEIKKLIRRAIEYRDVYSNLRRDMGINEFFTPPPNIQGKPIEEIAARVREWLQIEPNANKNFEYYREKIYQKNIVAIKTNGYIGKWRLPKDGPICGLSVYDEDTPLVIVRSTSSHGRNVFTLIHELAHILMHSNTCVDEGSNVGVGRSGNLTKEEREANEFAEYFLVTKEVVDEINKTAIPEEVSKFYDHFKKWRRRTGASTEAIIHHLVRKNLMTSSQLQKYRKHRDEIIKNKQTQTDTEKAKRPIPRLKPHKEFLNILGKGYVNTVLNAYNQKKITLNKASEFLNDMSVNQVYEMQKHLLG